MLLEAQSINTLQSQFYDLIDKRWDDNTTLTISTSVYNAGAYKAGAPTIGTFAWTYQPVAGDQILPGLFTLSLPASAIGAGPNAPNCVFPITLVTIGIASDNVTVRFTDVVECYPQVDNS